jgi:PEP-CTERM motif
MFCRLMAAGAFAAVACLAAQAHAAVVQFTFSGGGVSGSGWFTYVPDVSPPDPNPLCGTPGQNPCRADPPGAYKLTAVTGTFSDPANGIRNANITGLVPISPADERDPTFDPLVPTSLSFIDYAPGEYLTYNNLFFPNGSPIDCDFPYSGTFVDVFGTAFTVDGGYIVDLWGDGDMFGPGTTTYGVAVVQGANELVYQFSGVNAAIPEPATWGLMLIGLGALGAHLRRARRPALAA